VTLDAATRARVLDAVGADAEVRFDEPMARHTTLRIGGPVDAWVMPRSQAAVCRLRAVCKELGLASRGFGAGSNLLVRDGGVRGVALSLRYMARVERVAPDDRGADDRGADDRGDPDDRGAARDGAHLWVEAGAATGKLLAFATLKELGGVEFLGGVPGTVGGGLMMNAGTYLGEFKDVTTRVFSVDEAGATVVRGNVECGFAYRASAIPPSEVVTHARLRLFPRPRAEIERAVRELKDRRRGREPHGVANAGSIFKNPPGDYAGRLIEAAGCKGRRVGGAEVSPVHANWLVNVGGATCRDMLELIEIVRAAVVERHGCRLELEVKIVGEDP
jgi:UDP-N-acetylmuramate dehydrogenase